MQIEIEVTGQKIKRLNSPGILAGSERIRQVRIWASETDREPVLFLCIE